uniref:CSON011407 protein n=1 Tax=Culicoides sonorensis TaxID=179676 RepID=A0A336MZU7_CULSO
MVQKTIEIMSFGATPLLAPSGSVHTVPRKRRPRAAGEVFITSHSNLYFVDPKSVIHTNENEPVHDPIYQNLVNGNEELNKNQRNSSNLDVKKVKSKEIKKRESFCSVRIRNCEINEEKTETQQVSAFIDDFDHHYESLCSMEQAKQKLEAKLKERPLLLAPPTKSDFMHLHDEDSFDSFESDCESDTDIKKADSGVDIHNVKLPDPPQQPKQVYAIMQKIKSFGSMSKSEISKGFNKIRKKSMSSPKTEKAPNIPGQQYENTTFYVQNDFSPLPTNHGTMTMKEKPKKKNMRRSTVSGISLKIEETQPYENHDFHSPIKLPVTPTPAVSTSISSPILSHQSASPNGTRDGSNKQLPEIPDFSRKKSKSGRSFKSKLRKSFATDSSLSISGSNSSTYGSSRSTFYISDSVDVDSGIFADSNQRPVTTNGINGTNGHHETNSNKSNSNEKVNKMGDEVILRNENRKSFSPDSGRRRSSSTRPNIPPPPPPPLIHINGNEKDLKSRNSKKLGTTSWYAECGVFKPESFNGDHRNSKRDKSTSWYAEAGLYQTSGESVISSSGSSGVSTGGEGGPESDTLHSMFINEPLYQIYNAARLESISRDIEIVTSASDTDGYEEVGLLKGTQNCNDETTVKKQMRPTALQLVEPNRGSNRTLWSEVPEVLATEILLSLTSTEKYLQEAKFEILTSEASYLKSLNLLKSHFMNHPAFRDTHILSAADRKTLFSYIIPVQECSDRLLSDLESCWQDNIMLIGLSESLQKHVEKYFHVYISYCEHQGKMDRTLKKLKEAKGPFAQVLETLEADPVCCGLSIHSFLMLPMQRITRLPLLIEAVLSRLKSDDDEREIWSKVKIQVKKIATQCNEAANRCEQQYLMQQISKQIEFPAHIRPLPIVQVGVTVPGTPMRTLVKKGELTHLIWRGDEAKLTFGKKFSKSGIYAFLFTDLLVLTKRKGEESYLVFDHCQRSMLTVSSGDVIPQLPTKEMSNVGKHLIIMTLLENYEGKTVEMILSCSSESERERWLQATEPPCSENPDEKLYEQWDCPQVIVKHKYQALQPDEISLEVGDVINVFRKMADGWYHGERISDAAQGWFPGNFAEEVNSAHVRARNLKERYRVLTFTANYIESQKKQK